MNGAKSAIVYFVGSQTYRLVLSVRAVRISFIKTIIPKISSIYGTSVAPISFMAVSALVGQIDRKSVV